jgi:acyl dehydratase
MPDALYFEDFPPGEVVEYGGIDVSVDEVIAFAREFDPQPFHTEVAARATMGGLIASGWHTSTLLLRMNCDAFLVRTAVLEEAGVEEVHWQRPVRPGDRLHVRRHTVGQRPREDRTGAGDVEFLYEVVNQDGEAAMTQRSVLLIKQHPQPLGN